MKKPIGFWGWLLRIAAVGYTLALLAIVLALRLVGERWWVTTVALYLPRAAFALPLPFLVLLLTLAGPRRLLLSQLVAIVILVFPLMGWQVARGRQPTPGAAAPLRLLSFNIASGEAGTDAILAVIREANPDVVCLQEAGAEVTDHLRTALPAYHFHSSGQFTLATRLPLAEVYEPSRIVHDGLVRSAHFIRYRLAAATGIIQLYNVHPPSPRTGLEDLRGDGFREQVKSGRIFWNQKAIHEVSSVASLRTAQMRLVSEDAAASPYPVIIAGDTNLPGLSWTFGHWLGGFQDGFAAVGNGFGYTFPATRRAWMRIDRILADGRVRFLRFSVVTRPASDHFAVVADLEI